jgi:murein L,D-transpeptidase YcbB/YkuD
MVYQHDTPAKHLFAKSERALSHGCVRVQHPEKYAEVLLSITQAKDGFTAEQLKALYGDKERTIQLKSPVMVHLTYQTAFVDDAGRLQLRKDLYGRDARLLRLLRNERAVADLPVEPGSKPNNNPVLARNVGR